MRQKTRRSTRRRHDEPAGAAGQDPATWVLVNETGWGMPHGLVAAIAAAFVVVKAIDWFLGRRPGTTPPEEPPGA